MLREILGSRKFLFGLAAVLVGMAALWLASGRPFARPFASQPLPVNAAAPVAARQYVAEAKEADGAQARRREERRELEAKASRQIDKVLGIIDGILGEKAGGSREK